ncbi:MAG: phosphotransferase, partial [Desulfobacterales bacterium]|nr:phosphotransferase [Desulfobacterales bacterium]
QNFHLNTFSAFSAEAFVLKIANGAERVETLDFQNRALMHITRRGVSSEPGRAACPGVRLGLDGKSINTIVDDPGNEFYARVLTWLPGKPLAAVKPHDPELLFDLGRFFGEIDSALEDFDHPAGHHDFHWDLKNAGQVIHEYVDLIENRERRDMIKRLLLRHQSVVEPRTAGLRAGVIHNDGNDYNVLTLPRGKWGVRVSGVIDLGDMVHTRVVYEPAIVCAYAMMGKADPLAAGKEIVAGYHEAHPLFEEELAVLFDLILMRLCMSVCHSANRRRLEPDNEYLLISQKPARDLLRKLAEVHPRFAHAVFRCACGLPPAPRAGKIMSWLKEKSGEFATLTDTDPSAKNVHVLDLGPGSVFPGLD